MANEIKYAPEILAVLAGEKPEVNLCNLPEGEFKYTFLSQKELELYIYAFVKVYGNRCNLNWMDVSRLDSLASVCLPDNFNCDISKWDVSNVKNMCALFKGCVKFDRDISGWDVRNCTAHDEMFSGCPCREEFRPRFKC